MNKTEKIYKSIFRKKSRKPNPQNQNEENFDMYIPIKKALDKVVENIYEYYKNDFGNTKQYLETGFKKFFLRKGDLIILASKRRMTSFVSSLITNIAIDANKPIGYITCGEKDAVSICTELLSHITKISKYKLLQGYMNKKDAEEISVKAEEIFGASIYINETPNIFYEEVEFTARLMVEQQKVELIIIDSFKYLEEIIEADKDELPYIQKKLLEKYKEVAERLNIPIIILMDLPGNDDREPSIADFKKNMIIPRTVDQVLLLHQERIPESLIECEASLITAKNAHGINLNIPLKYDPSTGVYKSGGR